MYFELVGEPVDVEVIAVGHAVRDRQRLRMRYGGRRWRKLKGSALVRISDGRVLRAEVHWYEAQGVGRVRLKVKRFLD